MQRFPVFFSLCLATVILPLRAQDAATPGDAAAIAARQNAEENFNVLKGHVEDLLAAQADQQKHLQALAKELEEVRQTAAKPSGNFASQEDLDKLAQAVRELDKKREEDKRLILEEIEKLGKAVSAPIGRPNRPLRDPAPVSDGGASPKPTPAINPDQTGFYYVIKSGDTLSLVAQAYREQGIRVTTKQILDANPNLDATKLYVGKKIFIPSAKGSKPVVN